MMEYQVIKDPTYGYSRLDPIPSPEETAEFYQNRYFDLIKQGNRAPEIRRQAVKGEDTEGELAWQTRTMYGDIAAGLDEHIGGQPRRLLDIGSGTGAFIRYMSQGAWDVCGIEPSADGSQMAKESGISVYNNSLEDFIAGYPDFNGAFDAVTLLNVLEHVPAPVEFLGMIRVLLKPQSGILCIRVPNDFNELQACAVKKLHKKDWWVAVPDHINYFSFVSLRKVLESLGFEVVHQTTDFPMEIFLLMGEDYIADPDMGSRCHQKRVSFEMAISDALRRGIYRNFAENGIGRNCLVFARIK